MSAPSVPDGDWVAPTHTIYDGIDPAHAISPHIISSRVDANGAITFTLCQPFLTVQEIRDGKDYAPCECGNNP